MPLQQNIYSQASNNQDRIIGMEQKQLVRVTSTQPLSITTYPNQVNIFPLPLLPNEIMDDSSDASTQMSISVDDDNIQLDENTTTEEEPFVLNDDIIQGYITPPTFNNGQLPVPGAPQIPVLLEPGFQITDDNDIQGYITPPTFSNGQLPVPGAPQISVLLEPGGQIIDPGFQITDDNDNFPPFQLPSSTHVYASLSEDGSPITPEDVVFLVSEHQSSDDSYGPDEQVWDNMEEAHINDVEVFLDGDEYVIIDDSIEIENVSSEEEDVAEEEEDVAEEEEDVAEENEDIAENSFFTEVSEANATTCSTLSNRSDDFADENTGGNSMHRLPDEVAEPARNRPDGMENEQDGSHGGTNMNGDEGYR